MACCALLLTVVTGCRSGSPHQSVIQHFDQGNAAAAVVELDALSGKWHQEEDILALDRAVVELMAGNPGAATAHLETARSQMDYLEQKDVTERTVAALKDDRSIAWSGREYERRMVDNLQVLASLLNNDGDALALAQRGMQSVHQDQLALQDDGMPVADVMGDELTTDGSSDVLLPPPRFAPNCMVAFLSAAVTSERIMDADVTDRNIQQIAAWGSDDGTTPATLASFGTRSAPGTGVLQVVTLAGRVTPWESERAEATSAALLIADRILSATGDHTLPPTISAIKIGRPVFSSRQQPWRTAVSVGGSPPVLSHTLVDVNKAAFDSYLADRDERIARGIVRRIVKKGTVYAAKNGMAIAGGSATDLLFNVAGIAWEATEQADLRHWELLPEAIEVAQMELPAGTHTVTLDVRSAFGPGGVGGMLDRREIPVTIENGRNTFVICFRPEDRLVGIHSDQ